MEYFVEAENERLREYGIEYFPVNTAKMEVTALSHIHPAVEILLIRKGLFSVGTTRETLEAGEGDVVLFRSGEIHTISFRGGGEGCYHVLKISPQFLMQIFAGREYLPYVLLFLRKEAGARILFSDAPDGELCRIADRMAETYERRGDDFFIRQRIHAAAFLLALTTQMGDPSLRADPLLNVRTVRALYGCLSYINENFASDITPYECADRLHLSYSYFARLFRSLFGETFKEYLRSVRLTEAKNKVVTTDLPITEIASCCGYSDLSYFIAEFRRAYGVSPGKMRLCAPKATFSDGKSR